MDNYIKVAGVTFENPDGESRQKILKGFGFGFRYAILKQTTFENERAVEIWVDSKLIGYVPRTQLDNPLSYRDIMLVQILYYEEKGIYCAEISELQPPSDAEIRRMVVLCKRCGIVPPPEDVRAYRYFNEMFNAS